MSSSSSSGCNSSTRARSNNISSSISRGNSSSNRSSSHAALSQTSPFADLTDLTLFTAQARGFEQCSCGFRMFFCFGWNHRLDFVLFSSANIAFHKRSEAEGGGGWRARQESIEMHFFNYFYLFIVFSVTVARKLYFYF